MTDDTQLLVDLIETLRHELEAEVPVKLHASVVRGKATKGSAAGDMGAEYESAVPVPRSSPGDRGWTGLPFTRAFQRYLGHSENYGYEFIAAASFDEIAAYCRTHHDPSHFEGGPSVSLCRRVAVAVVELRQPLAFVAASEETTIFAVRKLLLDTLCHAAEWRRRRQRAAVAHDTPEDPPSIESILRRQHDEPREERAWNLLRLRHPYLPDWGYERGRRMEQHRKLGCPECMTAAA